MNWDAIGAIAEMLGAVAVLATLIYLAVQTRNISKQSHAEARYAFIDAVAQINTVIAGNKQAASVWRRGLEQFSELDEDEKMQFMMFVGQYANLWSVMHQLHEDNLMPPAQWQIVKIDIASILNSDGGRYFWEHGGATAFDDAFIQFINAELAGNQRPYDMAKMTKV